MNILIARCWARIIRVDFAFPFLPLDVHIRQSTYNMTTATCISLATPQKRIVGMKRTRMPLLFVAAVK